LIHNQPIDEGCKLECPRCGHVLYKQKHKTISKSLAFVITALICFFPAVSEPIMLMTMGGHVQQQSLISGIRALLSGDYYLVAILTFMSSMAVPFFRLVLLFYVTFSLFVNFFHNSLTWSFRLYHHMEEWAMLEVYMLGIIVSVVKLSTMAEIQAGFGLWAYVVLLLSSVLSFTSLNSYEVWELLLERKERLEKNQSTLPG
jgi:paraquat-inducible protein A